MYVWNLKKLRSDLREGKVTDANAWPYFITVFAGLELALLLRRWNLTPGGTAPDRYAALVAFVLTVAGLFLAYRKNGGTAGTAFLNKFFPLLFVISVRVFVFLFPVIALLGVAAGLSAEPLNEHLILIIRVGAPVTTAGLTYWLVGQELQRLRTP